jgi:hypothetical protein
MNLYDATIPVFTKLLHNVERWLDKAETLAAAKKFDPELLLGLRLAPDQYPLLRQIQAACDMAKFTAARLAGKTAPEDSDGERTLGDVRARLAKTRAYLESLSRTEFDGALERRCVSPAFGGKGMRGGDYLDHWGLPNLHFHLTTAYAILRHNGVDLGKVDYLGELPLS